MPRVTKVIGYIRVSTDLQAEAGVSLEAQEERLRAYAVATGLELVEVVVDAVSAKTLERPGLRRVFELLERQCGDLRAEGVLVAKLDRLTRSVRDLAELLERYFSDTARTPRALLSIGDSIDTRSAAGRLTLNVLASVAQWEREAIAERTRDALAHKAERGELVGAVPYGKRLASDGVRLEPCPEEFEVLEEARRLRAGGASLRAIGAELLRLGHAPRRGGVWAPTQIARMCAV